MGSYRIGFDIGGTFTDFILYDEAHQTVRLHKRLTSAHDPSEAALIGLGEIVEMAGLKLSDIEDIIHGTTLVTNTIIERSGAPVALITTQGFRDILEFGTEQRYDIYDLHLRFPEPLVARNWRLEVPERLDRDGAVITPLDESAVRALLRQCVDAGIEAVAVCFLNAYRNPAHEARVGAIASAEFPTLRVSLSSEVVAEMWEYQRCVTTCANAYVQPLMASYLDRLESRLRERGFAGALRLMHSAGGLVSLETARALPIRLLESGPAGGGLATVLFGKLAGKRDVISFDMGGTTAKACLVEDGAIEIAPMMEAARVHRFTKGSGLPIKAPVIDMIEIGAGGGSIARIDEVGLLKVGPHSAGSHPGPACYGLGGTEPTVTDANLLLGYYDPGFFLGGRMTLDLEAARAAVQRVATPLGLDAMQAAWGIHRVVSESMASAARVHLVEKGKDPRRYAMVGFGGAGPAHAADVARALGVREVIIPPASGAASALGFLSAPLSFEAARSYPIEFGPDFDAATVNRILDGLEADGRKRLVDAGVRPAEIHVERFADMRLVGQMHDVAVALGAEPLSRDHLATVGAAFAKVYTQRYSSLYEGARFEAINFRVRCVGPEKTLSLSGAAGGGDVQAKIKGSRRAYFEGGFAETQVYDRYALVSGDRIVGPAIIEEREATTVIAPGDTAHVDDILNLVITVGHVAASEAVVTPDMPLDVAIQRIEADSISLEIMWSRLVNVVEEMWLTVCRTAFSLVISEAQDFACDLLDVTGETLAHSPRAMPVFNLTVQRAVKALIAEFPVDKLKPGDVLMTNDPWLCAGHLFDIACVTPVFVRGRVVGLTATVGNVADIGGTKDWLHAREIYEEGFQIPPMKLYSEGKPDATFFKLFAKNVRLAEQVIGDIHSFVTANQIGADRLTAFMDDYGMGDLRALTAVVQQRSEKATRDAIRAIPDGVYTSEIRNNPLGQTLVYPLKLTVAGDTIELDFEGAPAQLPQGGFNCTLNYTEAHSTYPLKCMLSPAVRGNAGCFRPFTVKAPEGSILNALYPAAVNVRQRTGWYTSPNIFRALAAAAPDQVLAATGLPFTSNVYGRDSDGRIFSDILFTGGGQGGSARADGVSGWIWPTSAANTSIELLESRVPIVVLEKSYIPDSGGPGEFRGGLGQRLRLRKLFDDGLAVTASCYPEGVGNPTDGLFGGAPGGQAFGRVVDDAGHLLHDCGTGDLVQLSTKGEIMDVAVAGGAGYGDPRKRARVAVDRDVRLGLVSREGALRDYGVTLLPSVKADRESERV